MKIHTHIALLIALLSSTAFAQEQVTKFTNESEAGLVLTSGNTSQQTYNFKQSNLYQSNANIFKFSGLYLNSVANDVDTSYYWNLALRYERELTDVLGVVAGEKLEQDRFAGYLHRFNTDAGLKYSIFKEDAVKWFVEAGYRYQAEDRRDGSQVRNNQARLYTEYERILGPSVSAKLWFEYMPNFTNSVDYQINTEASVSAILTSLLSLKFAYLLRFDNLPAPGVLKTTDTITTTSLVAKF